MFTKCGCKRAEEKKTGWKLVLIILVYCLIEVVWLIAGMAFDILDLSKSKRREGTEPEEYISGNLIESSHVCGGKCATLPKTLAISSALASFAVDIKRRLLCACSTRFLCRRSLSIGSPSALTPGQPSRSTVRAPDVCVCASIPRCREPDSASPRCSAEEKDGEKERDKRARHAQLGLHRPDPGEKRAEELQGEAAGVPEEEPPGDHDGVRGAGGRRARDDGPQHGPDQGADDLLRLPRRDAPPHAEDDHPAAGGLQPRVRRRQPGHPLPG